MKGLLPNYLSNLFRIQHGYFPLVQTQQYADLYASKFPVIAYLQLVWLLPDPIDRCQKSGPVSFDTQVEEYLTGFYFA
jgi:hypothetical protein